jgi:hypothetical protein
MENPHSRYPCLRLVYPGELVLGLWLATFLREVRLSPRVERGLSDCNPWMSKMGFTDVLRSHTTDSHKFTRGRVGYVRSNTYSSGIKFRMSRKYLQNHSIYKYWIPWINLKTAVHRCFSQPLEPIVHHLFSLCWHCQGFYGCIDVSHYTFLISPRSSTAAVSISEFPRNIFKITQYTFIKYILKARASSSLDSNITRTAENITKANKEKRKFAVPLNFWPQLNSWPVGPRSPQTARNQSYPKLSRQKIEWILKWCRHI